MSDTLLWAAAAKTFHNEPRYGQTPDPWDPTVVLVVLILLTIVGVVGFLMLNGSH